MLAVIAVSALMAGSVPVMETPKPSVSRILDRSWTETLVVGHRGAAAYQPENSLAAFRHAITSGAVATECDVHLSQDRQIVVMHDKTLDRTTVLKGAVAETTAATMKAAGVPTLADLTAVTKGRIALIVEIKDGDGIEKMVVDHLTKESMLGESIAFSFGHERVARAKEANRSLTSIWLCAQPSDHEKVFQTLRESRADGLGLQFKNATPELAKACRERRIPLFVWTVPPGPEVDRLKALRVNFIITDHPNEVVRQLEG